MDNRLILDHFAKDKEGTIAVVSRQYAPDWQEFNLQHTTVRRTRVPDGLLHRVGLIAQAYDLALLARLTWAQARFPTEQLDLLVDECEWLYSLLNDPASQSLLQKIASEASQASKTKTQYPDIHWVLIARH